MKKTVFGAKERITQTGLNSISTVQNANAATESSISNSPGLIKASSLNITSAGLVVTLSGSSFGVRFGSGVVALNHGTVDASLDTPPAVTLTAPSTGSQTWYVLASAGVVQDNGVEVYGPPLGHPDYDPSFTPYQLYSDSYDTLIMSASLAPADNVTTFEICRMVVNSGDTTIAAVDTKNQRTSLPYTPWHSVALTAGAAATYTHVLTIPPTPTSSQVVLLEIAFSATASDNQAKYDIELSSQTDAFGYLYGVHGTSYPYAGTQVYQQTGGSIDIYLYTPAAAADSTNTLVSIVDSPNGSDIYSATIGSSSTVVPGGTLVLDTTDAATYPAVSSLANNVAIGGTLDVTGATTLSNTLDAGATTVSDLTDTGNATVAGTLDITGIATIGSLVTNSSAVSGTLDVTGSTTLSSVSATDIIDSGNASIGGALDVTGTIVPKNELTRTGQYMEDANFLPNPTGAYGLTKWTSGGGWTTNNDNSKGSYFSYSVTTAPATLISDDILSPLLSLVGTNIALSGFINSAGISTSSTVAYQVYTTAWATVAQLGPLSSSGVSTVSGVFYSASGTVPTGATKGRVIIDSGTVASGAVEITRLKLEVSNSTPIVSTPFSDEASIGINTVATPASLNATSGYTTLPGGLLLQWGSESVTTAVSVYFPVAFSAIPYSISMVASADVIPYLNTLTNLGFQLLINTGPDTCYWMAIGPA